MSYDFKDYGSGELRFAYRKQGVTTWSYTTWESASGSGSYSKGISGLSSSTTYEFHAELSYSEGAIFGSTLTFTTSSGGGGGGGGPWFFKCVRLI
jgi:hypothetical protein